jgi:hypothetical protein
MDERGRHIAAVPAVAAFPAALIDFLSGNQTTNTAVETQAEQYRRHAAECRQMAENAIDAEDKGAWLKLADAWLQMLPRHPPGGAAHIPGWPKPSDEDSQASH